MKPVLVPSPPAEIAALRSRFHADPHDLAARVVFAWRCVTHTEAVDAAVAALKARSDVLLGRRGFRARRERLRLLAEAERAVRWFPPMERDFLECMERIGAIPDTALSRLVADLRVMLSAEDFGTVDAHLGLLARVDRATAVLPDRSRLNSLMLNAFEGPDDAKAVFLAADASAAYHEEVCAQVRRMDCGEVPDSLAWREMAQEWWEAAAKDVAALAELNRAISSAAQSSAAAALRAEMPPEDFDRLCGRCGIVLEGV